MRADPKAATIAETDFRVIGIELNSKIVDAIFKDALA